MQEGKVHTDVRLVAILSGGDALLGLIDPEAILGDGRVMRYSLDRRAGRWGAVVAFPRGDGLSLRGGQAPGKGDILSVRVSAAPPSWRDVPTAPGKTLLTALADLSGTPVHLKRNLAPAGARKAPEGLPQPPGPELYAELLSDALFWGVEGADGAGTLERFDKLAVHFEYGGGRTATKARIAATRYVTEGKVTVSADADVYGIGNRKVTLEKNLGLGHLAAVDCIAERKGTPHPSLRVAFDLADRIPVLYEKERRKKEKMGTPRSRKA